MYNIFKMLMKGMEFSQTEAIKGPIKSFPSNQIQSNSLPKEFIPILQELKDLITLNWQAPQEIIEASSWNQQLVEYAHQLKEKVTLYEVPEELETLPEITERTMGAFHLENLSLQELMMIETTWEKRVTITESLEEKESF